MTKRFLEAYFAAMGNKSCKKCNRAKCGKTFCRVHMNQIKHAWREWSTERKEQGLCHYCDEPADVVMTTGEPARIGVRCVKHRALNKTKCLNWMSEHRVHIEAARKQRISDGFCGNAGCGKVLYSQTMCHKCILKNRKRGKARRQASKKNL